MRLRETTMVPAVSTVAWLVAAQLPAGWAQAQTAAGADQLEEIVVTAERRVSDVQKTASSVSVRNGEEMASQGRYSLAQILEDVPGVLGGAATSTGTGGSGSDVSASGLTIRGIQSNAGAGGSVTAVAPAAALYVDGVYEGVGGTYDIDRVEVLRGPQGTLYGRSATSGLVAIHTVDPQLDRLGGNATLEFGNYNLQHYAAAVNVPLVDEVLGIRVAGNRYERDGYFSAEGGARATTDAKVKLLYKPNEDFSVLLGYALQNNTTHGGGTTITLSAPNTYLFTPTPVGPGSNDFRQYWALINWNLGFATLSYQPAYRTWESRSLYYIRSTVSLDQTVDIPKDNFTTHELRLASNPDSKLIWQIGTLYYDNNLSNSNAVVLFPAGIQAFRSVTRDKTTRATGVFAEATYPVAESWRVTAGLRYDSTKVAVVQDYTSITGVTQTLSGDAGKRRFNNTTYKARLEHDLTAQSMLYASVSTGFSPGDVTATTGATGNPIVLDIKAETLTAYEIGSKNRFLENRLQVNGAVYYYDYGGYQTANVNVTPQGSPTFATLASPAQVLGGELETIFQLTPRDRIGLNLSYTNAYYVDKSDTPIATGTGANVTFGDFFARDKIPGVVPFTASLSYDRIIPLPGGSTLTLRGDVRYLSAHDATNVTQGQLAAGAYPYIRVDGEVVGDLNVNWASSSGRFSATGYVRNVGDNQYKTTETIQTPGITVVTTPYDPRTYGAVFNVHF